MTDLAGVGVEAPRLMVARPLPRTLFLVLSDDQVEDEFRIRDSPYRVTNFRRFLARGLRDSLEPYFEEVEASTREPSARQLREAGPSAVATVRLDRVRVRNGRVQMEWAFAVRPAEGVDYVFSYAGGGVNEAGEDDITEALRSMLKSALGNLLSGWTEEDVFQRFRDLEQRDEGEEAPPPSVIQL